MPRPAPVAQCDVVLDLVLDLAGDSRSPAAGAPILVDYGVIAVDSDGALLLLAGARPFLVGGVLAAVASAVGEYYPLVYDVGGLHRVVLPGDWAQGGA